MQNMEQLVLQAMKNSPDKHDQKRAKELADWKAKVAKEKEELRIQERVRNQWQDDRYWDWRLEVQKHESLSFIKRLQSRGLMR